jgi:ATP-dependent RNA helicase DeaD
VEAEWQGPPSAESIRAKDQARLLEDPVLSEPPSEEDLSLARLLLEAKDAETVAAALVRFHRARLPAPEDLYDDPRDTQPRERGERPPREAREPRPDRLSPDEVEWFRITVGRKNSADPKWLIPMICRLGHVTKPVIGAIRIFDRETKFEIARTAADKFREAIKATAEDDIKIEPAGPPGERPSHDGAKPVRRPKFEGKRTDGPPRKGPPKGKPSGKPFAGPKRKPAHGGRER